jgi:hypothetical protein
VIPLQRRQHATPSVIVSNRLPVTTDVINMASIRASMNGRFAVCRALLVALVFCAGAAAATVAGQVALAQTTPPEFVRPSAPGQPAQEPKVLSGADIGFRFDHQDREGAVVGTLMVKVNGKWVEARFGSSMRRGSE